MPLFLPFACNHSFSTHSCVLLLVTLTFSAKLYVCVEFLPSWWQPLHPSLATLYAPHIFRTLPTKLKHTSKYGGSWKGSRRRGQTYCQTWSVLVICKCCSWVVLLLLVSYFCFTFFSTKCEGYTAIDCLSTITGGCCEMRPLPALVVILRRNTYIHTYSRTHM